MSVRTFKTPAPWGVGPGPAQLYSIDGALSAAEMWLELTPARPETSRERHLMITLRDLLEDIPAAASEADLKSAKHAIKGMVKYARSRDAGDARISSYAAPIRLIPRRSPAKSG